MDQILEKLYDQPLLDSLSDEGLEWLADSVELQQFRPGEYVYHAGDVPTHFYLVSQGQIEVLEPAEGGERRRQFLYPQDFFGYLALRERTERQFSIRAAMPSEVIAIPAGTFFDLLEIFPEIAKILDEAEAERLAPPLTFPGQYENEVVIYWSRRHPIELLRSLLWPVVVGFAWTIIALVAVFLVAQGDLRWESIILTIWAAGLVPLTLWALWEGVDWWNDLYIVTDQRVINLERVVLLFEERREAPINKVQNVNAVQSNPVAAMLNYGDLLIETAAERGAIRFRAIPNSNVVAARILQEREKAREAGRRASESQKRQELRRALGLEPSSPAPAPPANSANKTERPSRISSSLTTEGVRYFIPRTREQQGEATIWRKHWIVLLGQTLRPLLLLTLVFFSAIGLVVLLPPLSGLATFLIILLFAVLAMFGMGWLLWEYEDWHNDIYILTPTSIIDEERRPLALLKIVKRASLDQIQDVRYEIPNPLYMLLNVGDVIIQTAGGEGRLDFNFVQSPAAIQAEIFRCIQQMAENRQARENARISAEILDVLRLYQEEVGPSADRPAPPD